MNICVFCSAADVDEKYAEVAREFGRLIAEGGHVLVWGGTVKGLMGVISNTVKEHGGVIRGVSIEKFKDRAHVNADEMVIAKDLAERKALLLQRSDALVAMVGGVGTLDEITEMIELKKYGTHQKPVAFLNTDGFFDGIQAFFTRADIEGFLHFPLEDIVHFARTPQELMTYLESYGR